MRRVISADFVIRRNAHAISWIIISSNFRILAPRKSQSGGAIYVANYM
jgi:hypothetical protein